MAGNKERSEGPRSPTFLAFYLLSRSFQTCLLWHPLVDDADCELVSPRTGQIDHLRSLSLGSRPRKLEPNEENPYTLSTTKPIARINQFSPHSLKLRAMEALELPADRATAPAPNGQHGLLVAKTFAQEAHGEKPERLTEEIKSHTETLEIGRNAVIFLASVDDASMITA